MRPPVGDRTTLKNVDLSTIPLPPPVRKTRFFLGKATFAQLLQRAAHYVGFVERSELRIPTLIAPSSCRPNVRRKPLRSGVRGVFEGCGG